MTLESIEQIMFFKYYNRIINLNFKETIIEAQNIYRKEKNDNLTIKNFNDFFRINLQDVLRLISIQRFDIIIFVKDFALLIYVSKQYSQKIIQSNNAVQ